MAGSGHQRVVWVTGAGSGIGRAAAFTAAEGGWRVVLSGRRAPALAGVAAEVRAAGGSALELPVDVRDPAAVGAACEELLTREGRLDALVLAAGTNPARRSWAEHDPAAFADVLATNTSAVASAVAAALPALRTRRGVVVAVCSVSAVRLAPAAGAACAVSKAAVRALLATLDAEEAGAGVPPVPR